MENNTSRKEKLRELISPVVKDNFMELVDIEIDGARNIRLRIDRPGKGITVDDCSLISRKVNETGGIEDIVRGTYSLEVSSPGINRPIRDVSGLTKFRGKKVKLVLKKPVERQPVYKGYIKTADENEIILDTDGKTVSINADNVKKARLDEEIF